MWSAAPGETSQQQPNSHARDEQAADHASRVCTSRGTALGKRKRRIAGEGKDRSGMRDGRETSPRHQRVREGAALANQIFAATVSCP